MAKPKKNRYSGIMIHANQYPLSRVNSLSVDTDLNEEEIREIGNEEIVERVDQTPTVSVTIDTNEYDSILNLRYISQLAAGNIGVASFDGTTVDITMAVEEDLTFSRTAHINECVPVSYALNFDVGGLATESFNLESDNFTWYRNLKKVARSFSVTGTNADWSELYFDSWPWTSGAAVPNDAFINLDTSGWHPIKLFADGVLVETGNLTDGGQMQCTTDGAEIGSSFRLFNSDASAFLTASGANNVRLLMVETGQSNQARIKNYPDWGVTVTGVGGVSKGMIDILFTSGTGNFDAAAEPRATTFLRCQTMSVDVDLSRESLEELGRDRAYEKSLTLPVPVNITFNTLATDLEEYLQFADQDFTDTSLTEVSLGDFSKESQVEVRIWDTKDTATTQGTLGKLIRITGLDISTQSYGVDVGGNATQDFTATTSNFLVSGADIDRHTTPTLLNLFSSGV